MRGLKLELYFRNFNNNALKQTLISNGRGISRYNVLISTIMLVYNVLLMAKIIVRSYNAVIHKDSLVPFKFCPKQISLKFCCNLNYNLDYKFLFPNTEYLHQEISYSALLQVLEINVTQNPFVFFLLCFHSFK